MDTDNPVMAVALLSQRIAELEGCGEGAGEELGECLRRRGSLLMAMGDKQGAGCDMRRYLELNPEKLGELSGAYETEGREHCR